MNKINISATRYMEGVFTPLDSEEVQTACRNLWDELDKQRDVLLEALRKIEVASSTPSIKVQSASVDNMIALADIVNEIARSALAQAFGPLLCASDDPADHPALLAAQANYNIRLPGWCGCIPMPEQVYYRDLATSDHGWMCCQCRRVSQVG